MKPAPPGVRALAKLPSLGPASARMLAEAGVETPEALHEIGAVEAYRRLRFAFGKRVTASYLYALHVALNAMRWSDLGGAEKAALGARARETARQQDALNPPGSSSQKRRR